MRNIRIIAAVLIVIGVALGYFVYSSSQTGARFPFRLGLDLAGGTDLTYQADLSQVPKGGTTDAMAALRDVVEKRVNLFGVSEPLVQTEDAFGGGQRLIVELPGVTDIKQAVAIIGETPQLDFRLEQTPSATSTATSTLFVPTGLSGRFVQSAQLDFQSGTANGITEPVVVLHFNADGAKLFEQITRTNVGKQLGIFLDNQPISAPVIREAIAGGSATISGNFTADSAKELVRGLNFGALPVPITLIQTSTVGPTLGAESLDAGVMAGLIGALIVALFMVLWYRLPGLVASVALTLYVGIMMTIFKLIPVTLTAAGIAGFILSIGMAVDANILIFERMKEELRSGKQLRDAIREGFRRAWLSIRDSNVSSLITAAILFWFGTSLVKGFALTFALGVLVSMFSAISVTRTFLLAVSREKVGAKGKSLFMSGFHLRSLLPAGRSVQQPGRC